jgi:deoxycytidylate deaminase
MSLKTGLKPLSKVQNARVGAIVVTERKTIATGLPLANVDKLCESIGAELVPTKTTRRLKKK